jgi:hypothetical protein
MESVNSVRFGKIGIHSRCDGVVVPAAESTCWMSTENSKPYPKSEYTNSSCSTIEVNGMLVFIFV